MWNRKNYLQHHGILGQKWGIRRYQNEDGTLTPEGRERYGDLSDMTNAGDEDSDYIIRGRNIARRSATDLLTDDNKDKKYTYVYDLTNDDDNRFYSQFGSKVTHYELDDPTAIAGKKALGHFFMEKMLNITDENDLDALDTIYSEGARRLGSSYVEDLFTLPYHPEQHKEALEDAGAYMISRLLSSERREAHDEKMKRRGLRDYGTAANDIGRSILDDLERNGYGGMRDYNDYGSSASVKTPTLIFDPSRRLKKVHAWRESDEERGVRSYSGHYHHG